MKRRIFAAIFIVSAFMETAYVFAEATAPPDTDIPTDLGKITGAVLAGFMVAVGWLIREMLALRRMQGQPNQVAPAKPPSGPISGEEDDAWTRRDHKTFASALGERFSSVEEQISNHDKRVDSLTQAIEKLDDRQRHDAEMAQQQRTAQGTAIGQLAADVAGIKGAFEMFIKIMPKMGGN